MTIATAVDGMVPSLEIDLQPLERTGDLEAMWTGLEERADASFFLSWHWIGNWLDFLPRGTRPFLLTVRRSGRIVGLAILCPRTVWRLGLLRTHCWFLHETGDPTFDRIFVEYNGILADRSCAEAVTECSFRWLRRNLTPRHELILGGLDTLAEECARRAAANAGDSLEVRVADMAQWVDLDQVRRRGGDYQATLGKNTRSSVRRTARLYAERGNLSFYVAGTVDDALADFELLEALHQAHWNARGRSGAFDNPAFRPLHRMMIRRGLPVGAVRLCRVMAGHRPIGVLYNFVHRGRVLNYQGGFAYETDNKLKPGLLSHVLAIEDALGRGERCYDFMSTPSGHKPLLSNAGTPMNWLALGPDHVARQLDARLRWARGQAVQLLRKARRNVGRRWEEQATPADR